MLKHGAEYTGSNEKRNFDLLIANSLRPALAIIKFAIDQATDPSISPLLIDERIGVGERPFNMHKLWTPPKSETNWGWLGRLEKLSVDELAQIKNVREGNMHIGGRRGLSNEHQEYVLDTMSSSLKDPWLKVVRQNKTGILSRYGFHFHFHPVMDPNESDIRAEMDILDAEQDSLRQDIAFIGTLLKLGAQRGLR